jgi:hypothetical protein
MTVKCLRELLERLNDNDVLFPNRVRNISILRNDVQIGYIDFGVKQSVELFEPQDERQ